VVLSPLIPAKAGIEFFERFPVEPGFPPARERAEVVALASMWPVTFASFAARMVTLPPEPSRLLAEIGPLAKTLPPAVSHTWPPRIALPVARIIPE
jgi:hypothetical protein